MFTIELLPAGNGDCLWIEYGEPGAVRRILIDGGTGPTFEILRERFESLPERERSLELLVVTHVDGDHINGALKLLRDRSLQVGFGDIWFNGWKHLVSRDELGPVAGERLTEVIRERGLPWNRLLGGNAVCVRPDIGELPTVQLEGGLRLTVLSPYLGQLIELASVWEKAVRAAGLHLDEGDAAKDQLGGAILEPAGEEEWEPLDLLGASVNVEVLSRASFTEDTAEANGSSIALLAEYGGRRVLLAADAFPSVVGTSLERLADGSPYRLDAVKVAHHGSRKNTSPEVLRQIDCERYLVSTNGAQHHHPNPETIARILTHNENSGGTQLFFNYRSSETTLWDNRNLQEAFKYTAVYPARENAGIRIDLE